jgi:hypothetical protein
MHFPKRLLGKVFIFIIIFISIESAAKPGVLSLKGKYGLYTEAYKMDGREARRPGTTARLYFTPVLSFYGLAIGLKMDYFLTTEQKLVTQPINRISIAPSWSWGSLDVWNFSPRFSDLTLSGVTLKGVGVNLHPGTFKLSVLGGQSQQACEDSLNEEFERDIYGLQIGLGGFRINLLKAKDDSNSIESWGSALPQENLVAGTSVDFSFLNIDFKGEIAASAFTRDLRSDTIKIEGIPDFLNKIYPVHNSTRADYAYKTEATVPIPKGSIGGSYRYVGPGYTSLGLLTNHNDRKEYRVHGRLRPFRILSLNGSFREKKNNLIGDKRSTTKNNNLSLSTALIPSSGFNISVNYQLNRNLSEATSDTSITQPVDNDIHIITVSPTLSFGAMEKRQMVRFIISVQNNYDEINQSKSGTKRLNVNYTNQITNTLSANANFAWIRNELADTNLTVTNYGCGAMYKAFEGKTPISLNLSYAPTTIGNTARVTLGISYRFLRSNSIRTNFQIINFSGKTKDYPDYNEFKASLNVSGGFQI